MSIIYDALKKVQKDNTNTVVSVNKTIEIKNNPLHKKSGLLIILFLIVLGVFLGQILFGIFLPKEKIDKKTMENISVSSSMLLNTQEVIKKEETFNTSTPLLTTLPSLVLNGIFFTDDQAYALINNQVFKENDVVNGAEIVSINSNSVDLIFQGRNFTLKVE